MLDCLILTTGCHCLTSYSVGPPFNDTAPCPRPGRAQIDIYLTSLPQQAIPTSYKTDTRSRLAYMNHPSRSATPESVLANSLHRATTNIDDLTQALADFSRLPSPEPPLASCCCGREDCEHAKAWAALKARLESRLILSAGAWHISA